MDALNLAWSIYKQYNPDGEYLMMYVRDDDEMMFRNINNQYYEEDAQHPINTQYFKEMKENV